MTQETAILAGLVAGCAISVLVMAVLVVRGIGRERRLARQAEGFLDNPRDWGRQ